MAGGFLKTSAKGNSQRYRLFFGLSVLITAGLFSETLFALDMTPFNTKNQSPVVQIYGLPSAGNAILLPPGHKEFNATLDHSSNYVEDSNSREQILLDGETTRMTLGGRYGLRKCRTIADWRHAGPFGANHPGYRCL
jgi:hypothetical protein